MLAGSEQGTQEYVSLDSRDSRDSVGTVSGRGGLHCHTLQPREREGGRPVADAEKPETAEEDGM